MALLTALQGTGGGRIPMNGFSYDVSRRDPAEIINSMPTEHCRAMHIAARQGDLATAQRLLCEATEQYFTATPAVPTVAPSDLRRRARPGQHSQNPSHR
jgi:hypothetical protein